MRAQSSFAGAIVMFGLSVTEPAAADDAKPDAASSERAGADSRMYAADPKTEAPAPVFDGVMAAQLLPLQHDVLRVRGNGEHRTGSALLTGAGFYSLGREDVRIGKAVLDGKLGGGDAGFEGILRTDFGNGFCLTGVANCLYGRTLAAFELRGSERYFSRLFRLGMEAGYYYAGRNVVFDLGVNAALPLFGVAKVDGDRAESRLSVSPGASMLLAYSYGGGDFRLSADASRHEARQGAVDRLNVMLCSGGARFSLCTALDYFSIEEPAARDAIVTSLAFSFTGGGGVTHEVPVTRRVR